jgi:lipopolysaccharide biosynthesis glycosyltransferase
MVNNATICTIVAKNYIAFARTLCESFLQQHPNGKCFVLIIDDWQGYIDQANERFEIVSLTDLNIPQQQSFCFKYNITELATAVKPFLLEYLLTSRNLSCLLYLDPDILVTNGLDRMYKRLSEYDVVLTPHLDTDYPDDGYLPDDSRVMQTGIFNLGFFGVSRTGEALKLLLWWKSKLKDKCLLSPQQGYFVDQKFMDVAVSIFSNIYIERETGYNVAYWNLHSRVISRGNKTWLCNDGLLYFFHFSNFKPETPQQISGHQTRHVLANRPDLQELFWVYHRMLVANGYEESKAWPYGFGKFQSGRNIPDGIRRFYLVNHARWDSEVNPFQLRPLERLVGFCQAVRPLMVLAKIVFVQLRAQKVLDILARHRQACEC